MHSQPHTHPRISMPLPRARARGTHTHTYTQKYIILLLHGNSVYANAPQYYVIRILPVLLSYVHISSPGKVVLGKALTSRKCTYKQIKNRLNRGILTISRSEDICSFCLLCKSILNVKICNFFLCMCVCETWSLQLRQEQGLSIGEEGGEENIKRNGFKKVA